jgi:hypothetical protein
VPGITSLARSMIDAVKILVVGRPISRAGRVYGTAGSKNEINSETKQKQVKEINQNGMLGAQASKTLIS